MNRHYLYSPLNKENAGPCNLSKYSQDKINQALPKVLLPIIHEGISWYHRNRMQSCLIITLKDRYDVMLQYDLIHATSFLYHFGRTYDLTVSIDKMLGKTCSNAFTILNKPFNFWYCQCSIGQAAYKMWLLHYSLLQQQ